MIVFYAVNGNIMTDANRSSLFANDTFTINFANYNNGNFTPSGVDISFTKTQVTENPVFINNIVNIGQKRIAYLMYNGFTANFNIELNNAFGQIKAANATDLVLDLRYNGGGSIQTATYLASMITGQFNNQVFAREIWNPRIQAALEAENGAQLQSLFTDNISGLGINSLGLSKIYILTTSRTASASELVINGLKPYIQVIQIGSTTIGKNAGSITLYDSPRLTNKTGINTNHKYAMQPLVIKTANKDGFGDYQTGLVPNYQLNEDVGNLGILGNSNEPLFRKALDLITLRNRTTNQNKAKIFENVPDNAQDFSSEMYLDKVPTTLEKFIR